MINKRISHRQIQSIYLLAVLLFFMPQAIPAQESEMSQLRGAVIMGNSHIPQATQGGVKLTVIPTWGFDLDYLFNEKWAIGLQTDVKLQSFEVEDKDHVELSRNYPVSFSAIGIFRPIPHLAFFTGPGIEYEKSKSLWIFKIGAEYSHEFSEKFELGVGLIYENRQELYDGWTLSVSYNFRLWHKKPI